MVYLKNYEKRLKKKAEHEVRFYKYQFPVRKYPIDTSYYTLNKRYRLFPKPHSSRYKELYPPALINAHKNTPIILQSLCFRLFSMPLPLIPPIPKIHLRLSRTYFGFHSPREQSPNDLSCRWVDRPAAKLTRLGDSPL